LVAENKEKGRYILRKSSNEHDRSLDPTRCGEMFGISKCLGRFLGFNFFVVGLFDMIFLGNLLE
jgi:hypothetical protein